MLKALSKLLIIFAIFFALALLALWIEATVNYPKALLVEPA